MRKKQYSRVYNHSVLYITILRNFTYVTNRFNKKLIIGIIVLLQGVRIYAVQCQTNAKATFFYEHLAEKTYGKHLQLDEFPSIVDILLAICYRETGAEYFEVYLNALYRVSDNN